MSTKNPSAFDPTDPTADPMAVKMAALVHSAEIRMNHVPFDHATAVERLKDPEKMATWIRKTSSAQVRDLIMGWSVILSMDVFSDGIVHHHGSAMLYPRGRSSTEEDWSNLGQIVALSGAPEDIPMPFGMSDDPNAPQHWFWFEGIPADAGITPVHRSEDDGPNHAYPVD